MDHVQQNSYHNTDNEQFSTTTNSKTLDKHLQTKTTNPTRLTEQTRAMTMKQFFTNHKFTATLTHAITTNVSHLKTPSQRIV